MTDIEDTGEIEEVGKQTPQAKVLAMARQYHQSYLTLLEETTELRAIVADKVPALEEEIEELKARNEELNKFDRNTMLDFD